MKTVFQHFWVPEFADEEEGYQDHQLLQQLSAYLMSSLVLPRTVH